MNVTAVTSWGVDCGISEYAGHLQDACRQQDLPVTFHMDSRALDPQAFFHDARPLPDLVWLNYHAGLHSRWTPELVQQVQASVPVVITFHDTYDGEASPNSDRCKALFQIADAFIVHEPVADLDGAILLRQGVPDLEGAYSRNWMDFGGWERPVLGTVGFPFPWKNYDRLAARTEEVGWGLILIAPRATSADIDRWRGLNPWTVVYPDFLSAAEVVGRLAGCTATAFMYECHNTGTSGAIRQGIAARKPVYALAGCRQFRDLLLADQIEEPKSLIRWVEDWNDFRVRLKTDPIVPWDPGIIYLAERDSWRRQAQRYVEIFLSAVRRRDES